MNMDMIILSVVLLTGILCLTFILNKWIETYYQVHRIENYTKKQEIFKEVNLEKIISDLDNLINEELQTYFILNIDCDQNLVYINQELQTEMIYKISKNVMKHITSIRISQLHYIYNFKTKNELRDFIEFRVSLSVMDKTLEFNQTETNQPNSRNVENPIIPNIVDITSNF